MVQSGYALTELRGTYVARSSLSFGVIYDNLLDWSREDYSFDPSNPCSDGTQSIKPLETLNISRLY